MAKQPPRCEKTRAAKCKTAMRNLPGRFAFKQSLGRALRHLRLERRCLACSAVFREPDLDILFCRACAEAMPRRKKGYCPCCGELAAWPELPLALCAHCLKEAPPWQGFIFHGPHEGLLRNMLINLKFGDRPLFGHVLGSLLATHPGLGALRVEAVVPVPLHLTRLAARGYNQAQEIARPLARMLRLPLAPGLLSRTRATPPQTGANRACRKRNITKAFAAAPGAKGKELMLVDDTITTGATLIEAARALLDGGAASVSVAVVSRTPRHY